MKIDVSIGSQHLSDRDERQVQVLWVIEQGAETVLPIKCDRGVVQGVHFHSMRSEVVRQIQRALKGVEQQAFS